MLILKEKETPNVRMDVVYIGQVPKLAVGKSLSLKTISISPTNSNDPIRK
jgi:hypothetical protein